MERYEILGRIGEGAHGIVLKGKHLQSGQVVALKKVALKRLEDGIPVQILREIKALQELHNENIVRLREVFPHGSGIVLAFDFMLTDLSELIKDYDRPLSVPQIKSYLKQLLYGVAYMHSNSIMHRDLKPGNLLISSSGQLKIADMGLARLFFREERRPYSHQVATRWYRAPELLFGGKFYDEGVDNWAVGCIFGEMINKSPLFPGENDIEQIVCVFRLLGTPSELDWPDMNSLPDYAKISFPKYEKVEFKKIVPEADDNAVDLLSKFLVYDAKKRISAQDALNETYVTSFPLAAAIEELPVPKARARKKPANLDFDPSKPLEKSLLLPGDIVIS